MQRIKKIRRVKPKRKWWRNKFLLEGILVFFVIGIIFYTLFFYQALQIKEIKVAGTKRIAAKDIQQYIAFLSQRNILKIKTQSILLFQSKKIQESLLRDFPQIAKVNIKRTFPDIVEVLIEERNPVAIWCKEECFFIDKEGIIFEKTDKSLINEFLLLQDAARQAAPHLGEQVISKELLDKIFAIKTELKNIQVESREVVLVSEERINIKTTESWEIYFTIPLDVPWQITRLKLVLEKEIPAERRPKLQYVDLRFSKVYYRYRD